MALRRIGVDDIFIIERSDGVGGTWRLNTYPGAACDIQSHLYSFSFAPNRDWTRTYAHQPEILAYLGEVIDEHGLAPQLAGDRVLGVEQAGEQALDEMARDSRLRRTLLGVGSAVLGLGTLGILYRDQIFDNEPMPEPTEFNYLMIGLSLVNVAANVITVFSQTEEERLRANYRQELQLLRESTEE